jgi:hypothetical protein
VRWADSLPPPPPLSNMLTCRPVRWEPAHPLHPAVPGGTSRPTAEWKPGRRRFPLQTRHGQRWCGWCGCHWCDSIVELCGCGADRCVPGVSHCLICSVCGRGKERMLPRISRTTPSRSTHRMHISACRSDGIHTSNRMHPRLAAVMSSIHPTACTLGLPRVRPPYCVTRAASPPRCG